MLKYTYMNAARKRAVREFLIKHYKFKNIVGLAGPDINEYIQWCKAKGYKGFEIYEADINTVRTQFSKFDKQTKVKFTYGDILKADAKLKDTLYDLDFCSTIINHREHISKFKDNFIMTFSLRIKGGESRTIKEFFEIREEHILNIMDVIGPFKQKKITTENGDYIFISYRDTSLMCCIAKI